jgi:hypothetical protein
VTGTICFHSEIIDYSLATAQKVEDILESRRSDLSRIIINCDRSGPQGNGGIEAESQPNNSLLVEDDSTSSLSPSSSLQNDDNGT